MQICAKCDAPADSAKKSLCKACYNKEYRDYRKKNPHIIKRLDRRYQLKTKYGITQEQYLEMYKNQSGNCSICGKEKELLNIDHDHNSGKVRSLLCTYCNIVVGNLERVDVRLYLDYIEEYANLR